MTHPKHPLMTAALVAALASMAVLPGAAAPAGSPAAFSPAAGPCIAGGAYDPACDVNQNGVIDVVDIQLAASHWNQSGTWVSDNNHNHLGQNWTGSSALAIVGSFGPTDNYAPLVLNNNHPGGYGLRVESNGVGVLVPSSDYTGVYISSAGGHGVFVGSAGGNGVDVNAADGDGVYARSTGASYNGVYGVNSGGGNGVRGDSNGAITSGVYGQNSGGGFGVAGRVTNDGRAVYGEALTGWAGWFYGNVTITGTCTGCLQASFAVNVGTRALQTGDVVAARGVTPADLDNATALWEVLPAQPGKAAVGVVVGRAALVATTKHLPAESGQQLLPGEGAAAPGEYVVVLYSGPMQVKAAPGERSIAPGTRLTAAADGQVRPLETRTVDGMIVAEGAPVLGVALGEAADGMVWVLVNPQ